MTPNPSPHPKILTPANVITALVLIALFIGSCAALWVAAQTSSPASDAGLRAIVHDADGEVRELPLNENTVVEIVTEKGSNTVAVENGTVRVSSANCENQDCVRQGALSTPGKQIICLPHELWIEVVDADEDGDAANRSMDALSR